MSTRPTPQELNEITAELHHAMSTIAVVLPASVREEWNTLVSFIAVSQRIMAKTNPSKLRDATRAVWTQSLIQPGEKRSAYKPASTLQESLQAGAQPEQGQDASADAEHDEAETETDDVDSAVRREVPR
jgi:hypothetical protein